MDSAIVLNMPFPLVLMSLCRHVENGFRTLRPRFQGDACRDLHLLHITFGNVIGYEIHARIAFGACGYRILQLIRDAAMQRLRAGTFAPGFDASPRLESA